MHRKLGLIALLVGISITPAWANWDWTNLHPDGADSSYAQSISGEAVAGRCTLSTGDKAVVWNKQSGSYTDITPPGSRYASINSTSSNAYVGTAKLTNSTTWREEDHAILWPDTSGSFVDLHPSGYLESEVNAVWSNQQVGTADVQITPNLTGPHAGMWTGTAESWVDLNPTGAEFSGARAVYGGSQGGFVHMPEWTTAWGSALLHASLWSGSADNWVDLNPNGAANSGINGMDGRQQVGCAAFTVSMSGAVSHAGYWQGTAESWVDLNPTLASLSTAVGVSNGWQVGYIIDEDNQTRASIWQGTASSWLDLNSLLPSYYTRSMALGVEASGNDVWVVGYAHNSDTNRDEAMLWHQTVPEPSSVLTLFVGILALARLRRIRTK